MKQTFSNFELTKVTGTVILDKEYFANVDVHTTTGFWLWKTTSTIKRKIRREGVSVYWHFIDSGKMIYGPQVRDLARAWAAQTGQAT